MEIDDDIIYSAQYPLPDWEPMGGWSIDRALLLAITKQESGFRTTAKSGAGANGVMQLMRDCIHLNFRGEYLQAWVWYLSLFNESTAVVRYEHPQISSEECQALAAAAEKCFYA